MEDFEPLYRNLISHIDIDRNIHNIDYFPFTGTEDAKVTIFKEDILEGNDAIELNLVKTNAYKEAIIFTLKKDAKTDVSWIDMLRAEQKTFGGSKLFYLSKDFEKMLILSIPENMEGKLMMVIKRLNKINEKINRFNQKIKKDNMDAYQLRLRNKDKKDNIINLINQNLKV